MYTGDMRTQDARSLPTVAQADLRRKTVKAVLAGKKQREVAALFGVTEQAVCQWLKRYRQGGLKALRARRRGRPRGGKLKPWQAAQTAKAVVHRHPEQLRLPFCLWTRDAVAQLIERRFGLRLSAWTVGRYLKRWGFTPQKPVRQAFERNPAEVKRWLRWRYPAIRRQAKREKARIYWGDEMGLRSDHTVGTSYGRRGTTPVIPGTGKRFGCNLLSAITNHGSLSFMAFKQRFRTPVFLDFLKRLIRQARRKVFLIVDGHPVHRSAATRKWLARHRSRIRVFFLPGYSPELNPDECLNQDVKSNALGRQRPHDQKELLSNVRSYLRSTQRQPAVVRSFFEEEHVRYAAV